MKRFLYITVTVLAISAPLVYFLFIKENRDKIMTAIQNHGTTIAVHRVNIPEKISDIQQLSLSNIEIDLFNDNGILTVGHEKETSSNNSLLEYFEIINTKIPDFNFIWLDMKDLNKASEDLHISTLKQINNLYNIKNRVLIESRSPEALEKLSLQGWETGYYLLYELSDQPIE